MVTVLSAAPDRSQGQQTCGHRRYTPLLLSSSFHRLGLPSSSLLSSLGSGQLAGVGVRDEPRRWVKKGADLSF